MTEWIITSSVLILVVFGLRSLLKGKLSLRLQYGLWALVLLRLLIPLSIDSQLSIMNFIPEPEVLDQTVGYRDYQLPDLAIPEIDPSLPAEQQQVQLQQNQAAFEQEIQAAKERTGTPVTVEAVLFWVWIGGMAVIGVILVGANLHFAGRLRRSRSAVISEDCPLPVYASGCVATPCLYGPILPKIYLPQDFQGQCLDHVLTHELTHWRHGDHIWSLLRCVCLVLHWYNPLVWVAAILSRQDAELACDEAVIQQLGESQRAAYGKTLIEMSCIRRSAAGLLVSATTMVTTKKSLKERISMIAKKPKTAIITLICVLLIVAVAVGCTFTGASQTDSSEPPVTKACHFEGKNALYVYEKEGFGSDFIIKLNRDGTFRYTEGSLSQYSGLGTWTQEDDILALTDKPAANPDLAFYNEFRVEEKAIVWLAENSTGFLHRNASLEDGARFFYRGSEESPTPMVTYTEDVQDVVKGIFDGGQRATFINVHGVTFVWDHFAVDTLDGLAVTKVGTVTENDIMKIPETHLAACRLPVGTEIYIGKDVQNSQYPAVYCKWDDHKYYARFLPEDAFRGDRRWWEKQNVNDGFKEIPLVALIKLAAEKGALLSHTDFQGYSHMELTNTNGYVYKIYEVENGYRLMLQCANTQTPVEVISTKLYRKDTPDNYIDIRTDNIMAFAAQGAPLLQDAIIIVDNQTGDRVYATNVFPPE